MPYQFCETIASCATLEAVQGAFRREVARHGFTNSAYRQVVAASAGSESRFLFRNWSGAWTRRHTHVVLGSNNFAVNEAQRRMTPFTWADIRALRGLSAGEERAWRDVSDFGWRNAYVTPVHGPRRYLATVSMATKEHDVDLSPAQRLRLQMIALAVHERAQAISREAEPDRPLNDLSSREIECLRWVADGKTDWEIGMILSISSATVKFHLDRARMKLNAATRAQAVARLVLSGLH